MTGNKTRRIKRGKIVRSALDTFKPKQLAKRKKPTEEPQQPEVAQEREQRGEAKEVGRETEIVSTAPKELADEYADLSLSQINELKNQIEQKVYADFSG